MSIYNSTTLPPSVGIGTNPTYILNRKSNVGNYDYCQKMQLSQQQTLQAGSGSNALLPILGGVGLFSMLYLGYRQITKTSQNKEMVDKARPKAITINHDASSLLPTMTDSPIPDSISTDKAPLRAGNVSAEASKAEKKGVQLLQKEGKGYLNNIAHGTWSLLTHRNTLAGAGLLAAGIIADRLVPSARPIVVELVSKTSGLIWKKVPSVEAVKSLLSSGLSRISGTQAAKAAVTKDLIVWEPPTGRILNGASVVKTVAAAAIVDSAPKFVHTLKTSVAANQSPNLMGRILTNTSKDFCPIDSAPKVVSGGSKVLGAGIDTLGKSLLNQQPVCLIDSAAANQSQQFANSTLAAASKGLCPSDPSLLFPEFDPVSRRITSPLIQEPAAELNPKGHIRPEAGKSVLSPLSIKPSAEELWRDPTSSTCPADMKPIDDSFAGCKENYEKDLWFFQKGWNAIARRFGWDKALAGKELRRNTWLDNHRIKDTGGIENDPSQDPILRNFAKVDEMTYRGAAPTTEAETPAQARSNMARLKKEYDISTIIDVRNNKTPQMRRDWEKNEADALGITYHPVPLSTDASPDLPAKMRQIQSIIDRSHQQGKKVLVHCEQGINRTGGVVAQHQVNRLGQSPEKALESSEIYGYGKSHQTHKPAMKDFILGLKQCPPRPVKYTFRHPRKG